MNKKSQSGSAHLIIIAILALALIGALGFVYYQNFVQNKDIASKTDIKKADNTITITPSSTPTTPIVGSVTIVNDFLTSFLSYINPSVSGHTDASFAAQSSVLTDEFQTSITSPNQGLMYSPIILAQDIPKSFTVGSATTADDTSSVPVTLNFATPSKIIYNLVIVNNEWKISGVVRA